MLRSPRMRWAAFAGAIGLYTVAAATTLAPPDLRCIAVDTPTDAAQLSWTAPPDPTTEFQNYNIYHAIASSGPFTLIGTEPAYLAGGWVNAASGADGGPQYYYVTTVSLTGEESVPSDTLATIFLQVTQSSPLGSAVLDWNLPHDPPLPGYADSTAIYLEYPQGVWTLIDSVVNTTRHYTHIIDVCDDSLTFSVRQRDASGCVSLSNLHGAHFNDVTPPSVPVTVTVSVDTVAGRTVVDWDPSPEPDTDGYIVVLINGNTNTVLDTVFGQFNTTFVWPGSDPNAGPESYSIAAIDTCWHGNPASPNTSAANAPHTTVFVTATYDRCGGEMTVEWTPYGGWPVQEYRLYERLNNGPSVLLGSFPAGTSSFTESVQPFTTYCYTVKALGASPAQSSLSNVACRPTDYPAVPQWNYLRVATVTGTNEVQVVDSVDLSAKARRYHLERTTNGGLWEEVAVQPGGSAPTITFTDTDVGTDLRSYTYRVQVDDSCGVHAVTSNEGTSIWLVAEAGQSAYNHLRWNGYVQWAGAVQGYAIYRSIDSGPFQLLQVNGPTQWSYDDDVTGFMATKGLFCYYVEALEMANPVLNAVSRSNNACAVQEEAVWIPNAFIIGGYNNVFQPVLAYVDASNYELTIFNRWGQAIWTTHDPYEPWDGKVDGTFVPQGVYAYYCTFQNGAEKRFERRGTVTCLWGKE